MMKYFFDSNWYPLLRDFHLQSSKHSRGDIVMELVFSALTYDGEPKKPKIPNEYLYLWTFIEPQLEADRVRVINSRKRNAERQQKHRENNKDVASIGDEDVKKESKK